MTTQTLSAGAKAGAQIAELLRARNPLLWVTTIEEGRAERLIFDAAASASYEPRFWDCATGITTFDGRAVNASCTDPGQCLQAIRDSAKREVWIMRDLHLWLRDPTVLRALRSMARTLPNAPRNEARAIIVLSPVAEIPPELAGHAIPVEWPLPDRAEIAGILDAAIAGLPDDIRETAAPNGTRDAAIDAAVGLSAEQAQACYAKSLVSTRRVDPVAVASEKKRVIAKAKGLEWYDPIPGGLDAVGGLDCLKDWLRTRRSAFSPAARAYGLPTPRGVVLVGVPGCGKSLTAKAIGTAWGMPILRMDLGGARSKYVGESESNIRAQFKTAEATAPCVLWIDEIEKGMAGASQGAADGGVSADALGTLLTFMQECTKPVFVVATANDVSALPPEMLRKGRFDELFFVDMPTPTERSAVIRAALKSFGRAPLESDRDLVAATDGFTGAEISALVPDAMFKAFADGARPVTESDLIECARQTVPLSKTAAEKIARVREWAKGRARNASTAQETSTSTTRTLDI